MFCPKCGSKATNGAVFCQKCGAKLPIETEAQSPLSAGQTQRSTNIPGDIPKKKGPKKLFIILGAVTLALILLIALAGIGGREQPSTGNPGGVDLSQTYVNEAEGISFKYPSAWVPVREEDYDDYVDFVGPGLLVVLANEMEDLPEEDSFIIVQKYSASQEYADMISMSDDNFVNMVESEQVSIKSTSAFKLDGVPARKYTAVDQNGDGYTAYVYINGSSLYMIQFCWMGEEPGSNQRFFDAIMDSYTIKAAPSMSLSSNASELLFCGISMHDLFEMTDDQVIKTFGEPDIYFAPERFGYGSDSIGEAIFSLDPMRDLLVDSVTANADSFTYGGQDLQQSLSALTSIFGEEPYDLGDSEYQWTIDGYMLSVMIPSDTNKAESITVQKFDTDIPIDNDAYLGDDSGYTTSDPSLVGRWRSYDGGYVEFDENQNASVSFAPHGQYMTPDYITWGASNGRIILSSHFSETVTWELTDRNSEQLLILSNSIHDMRYYRAEVSTSLVGTWARIGDGSGWYVHEDALILLPDGTGVMDKVISTVTWASETVPITWSADDTNFYTNWTLQSAYDYTVSGNTLTIYFSNGSRVYTRVGN